MEILLFAGIALVVLALLGFGGVIAALRSLAWVLLVAAVALILLSLLL
jgi:uncharacterized membrane protein YtjA (UPF0391 family)